MLRAQHLFASVGLAFGCAAWAQPSPNLTGFSESATALCSEMLGRINRQRLGHFSQSFVQKREQSDRTHAVTAPGKMSADISNTLGVGDALNNKSYFLHKLWWHQSETTVKPNLAPLGEPANAWSREHGYPVPRYTGEMLFAGHGVGARMVVDIVNTPRAVDPMELKKVPGLRPTAAFEITVNDQASRLNEKDFREWSEALMKNAQMDGVVLAQPKGKAPFYGFTTRKRADGSVDYTLKIHNIELPFFRLTWLVEDVQRSLAEGDYRETRLRMQKELGIPANAVVDRTLVDPREFGNLNAVESGGISQSLWDEVYRLTPATREPEDFRSNGRKERKSFERREKRGAYDDES